MARTAWRKKKARRSRKKGDGDQRTTIQLAADCTYIAGRHWRLLILIMLHAQMMVFARGEHMRVALRGALRFTVHRFTASDLEFFSRFVGVGEIAHSDDGNCCYDR